MMFCISTNTHANDTSCYDMLDILKTKDFDKIKKRFKAISEKSCVVPAKIWNGGEKLEDYKEDIYYETNRIVDCYDSYRAKKYDELKECRNFFRLGNIEVDVDFKEEEREWQMTSEIETKSKKQFIKDSCFILASSISTQKSLSKEKDPYRIKMKKKLIENDSNNFRFRVKKYKEKYKSKLPESECTKLPFWYNLVSKPQK
ncbi:hypothetical protein [Bacteriovorax sp. BAL6_X]|uniref:hypothetical protein n=1 Tax=Bacteriovorax sp. BAL6_X TaxID=1201290 RepID=UPI0012EE9202|nr:hypothetical protein [Bacteriovorax sp. BAL6_X]